MIHQQNDKVVVLFGPATNATNADATNYFDRKGFNYAVVEVAVPAATATNSSAKLQSLSLSEGDTTSSFANIDGFVGTTNSTAAATEFVLPVYNLTSVGAVARFYLDLRKRKRYIKVLARPAASHTTLFMRVSLSRAETIPDTDAERGVAVSVIG